MRVQGPDAGLSHVAHLETLRNQAAPALSGSQGTLGRYYVSQRSSNKAGAGTLGNQNSAPTRALVGRGFVGDTKEAEKKRHPIISIESIFKKSMPLYLHLFYVFYFGRYRGRKS